MTVWVVVEDFGCEGQRVVGVCASLLEAEALTARSGAYCPRVAEATLGSRIKPEDFKSVERPA